MDLRVLVGAYACHPHRGSEPGVGWNWVQALAAHCRLDVITADQAGSREAICVAQAADPVLRERVRFHFLPDFDAEAWKRHPFLMRYYQPLYYRYYRRWMWSAFELAQKLVAGERFDLVHQLTMIGFREPGYLWRLPLPFVWGPVGGTQNVPWRFLPALGCVEAGRHAARNIINAWQFRWQSRLRSALERASGLMSTASDTAVRFREVYGRESLVVPASFAQDKHPLARVRHVDGNALGFVFSGLQVSRKGLPFALRALSRLPARCDWHLDVIGAGVMGEAWRAEAERLGIGHRVAWHGQVSRDRALQIMSKADVFVFPSLQEGSPAVVTEALSLGMPVVTTDHHGMADYVNESCGLKVPVSSPGSLEAGLDSALSGLVSSPLALELLSRGALERATALSGPVQISRVLSLYEQALTNTGHRSV